MGLATPPFKTSIATERANESHHRLNQGEDDRQPLMTAVEESPQVVTCSMVDQISTQKKLPVMEYGMYRLRYKLVNWPSFNINTTRTSHHSWDPIDECSLAKSVQDQVDEDLAPSMELFPVDIGQICVTEVKTMI